MGLRVRRPDEDLLRQVILEGRTAREQVGADPSIRAVAENLAANQRFAPWVKPNAHVALARSGVNADDDQGKQIMTGVGNAAAKVRTKQAGWNPLGVFTSALGAAGQAVETVGGGIGHGAKSGIRGLFTALDTGAEVVDAVFRESVQDVREKGVLSGVAENLAKRVGPQAPFLAMTDIPNVLRQTKVGVAGEQLARGERADLGSGYFPGGDVREEQRRRAIAAGSIGGEAITPGRFVASVVSEPGTKPYNIVSGLTDFATDLYVDPAAMAGTQFAKARQARKTFDPVAAGAVRGARPDVATSVFDEWITSQPRIVQALTENADPIDIWRRTNKKLPLELTTQLADAASPDEVTDLLRGAVGGQLKEKFTVDAFGARYRRSVSDVRLLGMMPGRHVDPRNLDEMVEQAERFGRNARLPSEVLDKRLNEMVRQRGSIGRFNTLNALMGDVTDHLVGQYGKPGSTGKQLTRMFSDYQRSMRKYFVDEIGNNAPVLGAMVDGNGFTLPSPHLFVEYIDRAVPLPDARAIRRATSKHGHLFNNPVYKAGQYVLDRVIQDGWKPLVLLRPAWTVRVVGEEQVRMAASGLDSMFRHPISAIAYVAGRKGGPLTAETWADDVEEYASALSRRGGGFRDWQHRRAIHVGQKEVFRGEEDFARSWGDELAQLHADPIAKRVAGGWSPGDAVPDGLTGNHVEDAKRWFWDGAGKKFRLDMAEGRGREVLATSRAEADSYIDTIFDRIRVKTAERPELVQAVASGRMGDDVLTEVVDNRPRVSGPFADRLRGLADEGVGPPVVKGDLTLSVEMRNTYDRAVDAGFNFFMSRPTNYLSRSPAFKQNYWNAVRDRMSFAAPEAQQKILARADEAGMGTKFRQELQQRADFSTGELSLDDVDLLAKGDGLEGTKKLLYDLSDRSQFFDMTRVAFSFGEAWKEMLTTWGRMNVEQAGRPLRRLQQGVEGARGAGFFYTDPSTGEEVFNYPFSKWITGRFLGYPTPLQGRVSGLNLMGSSVLPGLGPVVQFPVAKLLPNKPELDWIREVVLPFGDPQKGLTGVGGMLESQIPPWLQKVAKFNANPESDRVFGNTVGDVMAYLAQSGKYDLNTEDGLNRLETDAVTKAKYLYAFRGFAQAFAPSAPKPVSVAKADPNVARDTVRQLAQEPGSPYAKMSEAQIERMVSDPNAIVAQILRDDFRRMMDTNPDTAVLDYLDKYGEGAIMFMQGKTRAIKGGLPTTEEAAQWGRENAGLREAFPLTYGFFAPRDENGDYDYAEMERQLRAGEREALTPAEQVRLANARVGQMVYQQAKRRAEDEGQEGREWLSGVRDEIAKEFPGFDQELQLTQRAKLEDVMAELSRAAEDPRLSRTEAGQGVRLYLTARARALEALEEDGLKTFGGKRAAGYRDWLSQMGEAIAAEVPDFADLFDSILRRELKAR